MKDRLIKLRTSDGRAYLWIDASAIVLVETGFSERGGARIGLANGQERSVAEDPSAVATAIRNALMEA